MADAVTARCVACGTAPRRNGHSNTRFCNRCRGERLRRPPSRVLPEQGAQILALAGTIPQTKIQQHLGLSTATISRYLREQGVRVKKWNAYAPETIEAVMQAYEAAPKAQGKQAVREQFADVNVRSLIERHAHRPRQVRWTDDQIIEAVRMGGLVSRTAQARYFGRPNAYGGSIEALWNKRLGCRSGMIHGLGAHLAWPIARPGLPAVLVCQQEAPGPKTMCLWMDLAQHLRPDVDETVRQAIVVLARFQRWLFGGITDTAAITQMIREREQTYGQHCPRSTQRSFSGHDHDADGAREPAGTGAGGR